MEATATLKYLKASPQKVRLVADLVRGRKVDEALNILRFTKKTCAKDLEKLVRSAAANAENKEVNVDTDELVVSKIFVNEGPREKRMLIERHSVLIVLFEFRCARQEPPP